MTNEEALNWTVDSISRGKVLPEQESYTYMGVVKIALEKQIAKKPIIWRNPPCPPDFADDDWGYKCPSCGSKNIDFPDHHCECGQALDWSDIE